MPLRPASVRRSWKRERLLLGQLAADRQRERVVGEIELRDDPVVDVHLLRRDGAAQPALVDADEEVDALHELRDLPRHRPCGDLRRAESEGRLDAVRVVEDGGHLVARVLALADEAHRDLRREHGQLGLLEEALELRALLDDASLVLGTALRRLALARAHRRAAMLVDVVRRELGDLLRVLERVCVLHLLRGVPDGAHDDGVELVEGLEALHSPVRELVGLPA